MNSEPTRHGTTAELGSLFGYTPLRCHHRIAVLQRARVRMDGEVYDSESNQFLDAFEIALQFPTTPLCVKDRPVHSGVGGHVRPGSCGQLGQDPRAQTRTVLATHWAACRRTGQGYGISTTYTIRLEYFEGSEARTILGVMADEFPGSMSLERIRSASNVLIYAYQTHGQRRQA